MVGDFGFKRRLRVHISTNLEPPADLMKRPAMAAKATGLTEANLQAHTDEGEASNTQVNLCVQTSLRILGTKTTTLMETIHTLQTADLTGTEARLAEAPP